ncbi:MAG TPA: hypothetical protein VF604_03220 [Pyrinomonadaceae bacterium]|jgi:hypothetical protein
MHCPRCGQQQVSEDTRFCSRCGFPLGLVSEILAHGGVLPQLADLHNKKKKFLTRKNGLKIGLIWFLLFSFLLTPLAGIAGLEEGAGVVAILGFSGGLLMMLVSWMFLENEPKFSQFDPSYQTNSYLSGNAAPQNALPPPQSQPVRDFVPPAAGAWKAPNTGELVPHSVTDGTTKLLQKEE